MCEEKEQCQFETEITSEKSLLLNQVLQRPVEKSDAKKSRKLLCLELGRLMRMN